MSRRKRPTARQPQRPGYQLTAAKAPGTGMATTFTAGQVAAIMQASAPKSGQLAAPLPRPDLWATVPFGPGIPLRPAPINPTDPRTGRAAPRFAEFPVSDNLQIDPRTHVPWRTLQQAADMPLFRKCIQRRKSICDLEFAVVVDPSAVAREAAASGQSTKDVEAALRDKYVADISRVTDWLTFPDRGNGFDWGQWTGVLMENMLKYDAAVVYPHMTYGGELYALEVIDGKTIKPLRDDRGGRPAPPFPAYQQVLWGFPRGEFTAQAGDDGTVPGFGSDQLLYDRRVIRSETPYGMSPTEVALLDGLLWMRRFGWMMAEYEHGVQPAAFLKNTGETDWTVDQWELFVTLLNQKLSGNTAERLQWPMLPPGVEPVQSADVQERYKPDYDMFLIKLVAGDFNLTATELGFPEVGSLGASFHEGEEDVLQRGARDPDMKWVGKLATRLSRMHLNMPPALIVKILGLESEDEAAADAVAGARIDRGVMSRNEDRARMGMAALNFAEADMVTLDTGRGVVFLDGASKLAPAGTLIGPAQLPPGSAMPGQPGQPGQQQPGQDDEDDDPPARAKPGAKPTAAKAAEKAALRRFLAKDRARPFECSVLTAQDVPELAGDPRVVLKDGRGKALAGTGPAGTGTWTL